MANLGRTNLTFTNLDEANLSEANLSGADVYATLSNTSLSGAKYTDETQWPERFNPVEAGLLLVDGKE